MFEFIRDTAFRTSLENDYKELNSALAQQNWKTVQVFAGSIIEAVLIDYLLSINYQPDPLQMDLAKCVEACQKAGLISPETAKLSDVLRNYRNLIHPGRAIRLKEQPDENKASIAKALVGMIIQTISKKLHTGEFTAEQIVSKVEEDSSAIAIVDHLLDAAGALELENLLLKVLPERYFDILFETSDETLRSLKRLFRIALDSAPGLTKQKFGHRLTEVIKTENKQKVFTYEIAFLSGDDLAFFDLSDRSIIVKHLLWRLDTETPTTDLMHTIDGMEPFLEESQFVEVCANLLFWMAISSPKQRSAPYRQYYRLLGKRNQFVGSKTVSELAETCLRERTKDKYDQTLKATELLDKICNEPETDIPF